MAPCNVRHTDTFLCEKQSRNKNHSMHAQEQIQLGTDLWPVNDTHMACPMRHMTFKFLACDFKSKCWTSKMDSISCDAPITPLPSSFACSNEVETVPYTLVCDHRPDCTDRSDENFCVFPTCASVDRFQCDNKQCVLQEQVCDQTNQCLDGSDEKNCYIRGRYEYRTSRSPAVMSFDKNGDCRIKAMHFTTSLCTKSHFLCPGNWTYCMPVYVRCNGAYDCPGREDEAECESYVCPGFYRCRASSICVHSSNVCDGMFQCPQRDDELLCGFQCPEKCLCQGLAFYCSGPFLYDQFLELRFLDGHESGIQPDDLRNNTMLIFLNVADCGLKYVTRVEFPNLRTLNVARNHLKTIKFQDLESMSQLKELSLSGNPLVSLFTASHNLGLSFPFLKFHDVSGVSLVTLNITTFSIFPTLSFLNLSGCGVQHFTGRGFQSLLSLDLKRCPMEKLPANILKNLRSLREIWADNYKLCCPAILPPDFQLTGCHAPSDEISSCDALLRSNFYRVLLSVFSALALLGNFGSFVYRVFLKKVSRKLGFGVFVTHLCVSDFLMGVYLALIGVADRLFLGAYLWNDTVWKKSAACKASGFLSLLSSEVSAFIICLITLDRFLVLRFPFSRLRFNTRSAHTSCCIAWLIGIMLAEIPLFPITSYWEYYSQTGICIPLPITRKEFPGQNYSFGVTIILNFVLFLLITVGQVSIYWSIRINSLAAGDSTKTSNDLTVARRLISIALSDFLCWFPIGLLGMLAANGVPVPGEFNVAVAVIILPVNSAINPFLYTLNMFLESRRKAREKRRQKALSAVARKDAEHAVGKLDHATYTNDDAMNLIKIWIDEGIVSLECLRGASFVEGKENIRN